MCNRISWQDASAADAAKMLDICSRLIIYRCSGDVFWNQMLARERSREEMSANVSTAPVLKLSVLSRLVLRSPPVWLSVWRDLV